MNKPDLSELERIWALKQGGAITSSEYERLKAAILNEPPSDGPTAQPDPSEVEAAREADVTDVTRRESRNAPKLLLACAVVVLVILVFAMIGSGGEQPGSSMANVDENLTTADMNADENLATTDMTSEELRPHPSTSAEAEAQSVASLPSFDTASYCSKIGDTAGGSYEIEETCREEEGKALAALQGMTIPTRTLSYCSRIGETAGGSYEIMQTCVEQESDAADRL